MQRSTVKACNKEAGPNLSVTSHKNNNSTCYENELINSFQLYNHVELRKKCQFAYSGMHCKRLIIAPRLRRLHDNI